MAQKRGRTWGFEETNLLLDIWGECKIQSLIEDCPKRNLEAFERIAKKFNEGKSTPRTAEECRAKTKRLKVLYFQEKRKENRSGSGQTKFPYWEKIDVILGSRPISRPVASLDSLSCEPEEKKEETVDVSVADQMRKKYGQGKVFEEICPRCGTIVELKSLGLHETESGCLQMYSTDEEFVCPKCNLEGLPADLDMEPVVPGNADCASEVQGKHPIENTKTSSPVAFQLKKSDNLDKKKKPAKQVEVLQNMFIEFEKKDNKRFEQFIKEEHEREERIRKLEEEQEEKRERNENERFEKQMNMLMQMQMRTMSMLMGAGPSTLDMSTVAQLNLDGKNHLQDF